MTRLALPVTVLLAALAAWFSQGTLAVTTFDGPRIALLPISVAAVLISVLVGIATFTLVRAGVSLAPFSLLVLIVLPWLPLPLPTAVLMWAGSIRWLVWTAVAVIVGVNIASQRPELFARPSLAAVLRNRPRTVAGVLAFLLFTASGWFVSPSVPGGDEPHYLVITQSLLLDRDLKIENNHQRGDYQAYWGGPLSPHYIKRGRDNQIYSIHAPGLSAVVAPAFAIGGYRGVVLFLLIVAACGSALSWHVAWLATRRDSAAWFGWAAVTLSATVIFHSFAIYPDGLGAWIVLTGVWALLRADEEKQSGSERVLPWLLHGAALALLPWLHSRFALLAGTLGALILLRLSATKNPAGKAVAFLSIPTISAMGWIVFFLVIYGVLDPSAPYGSRNEFSLSFIPGGLTGLLFDQRFGLIANAPVLAFAIVGIGLLLFARNAAVTSSGKVAGTAVPATGGRRLGLELLFVIVPYLLTATSYAMWWAGWSAPARFANPAVPLLAIPCAVAWLAIKGRATRTIAAGSLVLTAFVSAVLVLTDGGRLAFNTRETTALWLDWASRLTALGEGVPAWFRGREGVFARDVAIWIAALMIAWWIARLLARASRLDDRARFATVVAATYAAAVMVATTVLWLLHGVNGITAAPAQLDVLRRLAASEPLLAVGVTPPALLGRNDLLRMMQIEANSRFPVPAGQGRPAGLGRDEQPLVAFPAIPAGRYRVLARTRGPGGWMMLGIAQDQFAIFSGPLPWPAQPIEITFPVTVRALVVRGDEEARRTVRSVVVEPIGLEPADPQTAGRVARRAVKYESSTVYFLDEQSFPEPEAFWVGGARESTVVIEPDQARGSVPMIVRNAPVNNRLTFRSGQWQEDLTLAPGEERAIQIPLAPGRRAVVVSIASASGFRPSESVPDSRDQRFLGAFLQIR
jgi:hypothetical protein